MFPTVFNEIHNIVKMSLHGMQPYPGKNRQEPGHSEHNFKKRSIIDFFRFEIEFAEKLNESS